MVVVFLSDNLNNNVITEKSLKYSQLMKDDSRPTLGFPTSVSSPSLQWLSGNVPIISVD